MADFGPGQGDRFTETIQVNMTPGASAHSKGSWSTFSGGVLGRCDGFYLFPAFLGNNSTLRTLLMDIGVGTSPDIVINNLMVCPPNSNPSTVCRVVGQQIFFPVLLPSGYDLKARSQSNMASHPGIYVDATPCFSGLPCVGSVVDTYGADTTNSKGVTLTAPNTENVWGSWSEIVASCERVKAMVVAVGHGQANWSTFGDQWKSIQIGIGGAGSEQPVFNVNSIGASSGTGIPSQSWFGPYYIDIPAGTRISGRHITQHTSASQRTIDVILYGIR